MCEREKEREIFCFGVDEEKKRKQKKKKRRRKRRRRRRKVESTSGVDEGKKRIRAK